MARVAGARPVTLDVQERVEGGDLVLEMHLAGAPADLVASGTRHEQRVAGRNPERHVARIFEQIASWPKKSEADQRLAVERLRANGVALGRKLLPEAIRRQLWRVRHRVTTLEILTNERWVPWEMIALEAPIDSALDETPNGILFLSELFDLTRWPKGQHQREAIVLDRVAFIAPRDSGLAGLQGEYAPLVMGHTPRQVTREPATLTGLLASIRSKTYDAWHFSGHGVEPGEDPSAWGIALDGTGRFLPTDLAGVHKPFGAKHPWVFLNACHTSRGARGLSGGDGLAHAFLDAGASVYVGALWAIESDVAGAFAAHLYADLLQGTPLAAAVRRTRLTIRDAFPGDPTWLAYTVYGPPGAHVEQGAVAVGERDAEPEDWPPVPIVKGVPAAELGRRSRQIAIVAALCLGAWLAWGLAQGTAGTPSPGSASDRERASSSNVEPVQSLPIDDVDEAPVQTDLDVGSSGEPPVERESAEQRPDTQEPAGSIDPDPERDTEALPRVKPTSSITPEEEATSTDSEKSKPAPECGPRQLTVRVGEPVRIDCAALTLSILFDRQFDHEIATLRVAPDGQQLEQFPFFEHGAISPVVESTTGRWRINVLSSSRADRKALITISEEIHE